MGSFASFMAALAQIFDPIKRLTNVAARMQKMLVSAESVFTLIDQKPEIDQGTRTLPEPVRGRVEFRGVGHRFPDADRDTLHDVSFTVEPGQTVALVGRSGSGKTTLVNMLPRFVLAETGTILVDDVPVNDLTLRSLRSHLSLVSQTWCCSTTPSPPTSATARWARRASSRSATRSPPPTCWNSSRACPTACRPRWARTPRACPAASASAGDRARPDQERAHPDPDEATSALDNESERQVQASLERLMRGRTTLVIAHRLSTVQNADRIIVLDAGRIVEQGAHSELLAANGLYASLYKMQFRED